MKLLPSKPDVEPREGARIVGLDSEDADEFINALSSETARRMLTSLHDDPATPSALADRIDTSLQNAQYHLGKLEDAGLVEIADTVYSEKGREMNVYAPADRALVVVAGQEETTSGLRAAITRLLGGIGILGIASLALQRLLSGPTYGASSAPPSVETGADGGAGGADAGANLTKTTAEAATRTPQPTAQPTTTSGGVQIAEVTKTPTAAPTGTEAMTQTAAQSQTQTPVAEVTRTVAETTGGGVDVANLPHLLATSPGLTFFLGGTTVLVGIFALWWWRNR